MVIEFIEKLIALWHEKKSNDLEIVLEDRKCQNCENYLLIIEKQRQDYQKLIDIMHREPGPMDNRPEHEYKPVGKAFIPFAVRRQMLEAEDRRKAAELRKEAEERRKPIAVVKSDDKPISNDLQVEQLEKALDINPGVPYEG